MDCRVYSPPEPAGRAQKNLSYQARPRIRGRWRICSFVLGFVFATAFLVSCEQRESALEAGLRFYRQNKLEEACPFFQRAVEQDRGNPDAHAWLAETYRRLEQIDEAADAARKALELDPCHSFAHTVLAGVFNPMYGSWGGANADATWNHLLKAAECDSTDGNIWIGAWVEAIRRGDGVQERKSLRLLLKTGFLTPPLLSYNRWMLRYLPERALLLTSGDWDTYPAVALQQVDNFRPDVAVVNLSLLNTTWYARFVRDRYAIPLPYEDEALDALKPFTNERGNLVKISSQIVSGWLDQKKRGLFPRPIAISITVDDVNFASDLEDHLQLAGAFRLWRPEPVETPLDTSLLRVSLASVAPENFLGSFVSPQDRSSVRIAASNGMVENLPTAGLLYCSSLIEAGRLAEATEMITWVEQFAETMELAPRVIEYIEELKKTTGQKME